MRHVVFNVLVGAAVFVAVSLSLYVDSARWYAVVMLVVVSLALPVAVGVRCGVLALAAYAGCLAATFVESFGVEAWTGSDNFQWHVGVGLLFAMAALAASARRRLASPEQV